MIQPLRSIAALALMGLGTALCENPGAVRLPQNPLITVRTSESLGDNVNGPSVIRVPGWVQHPLGRYYLYFAHHKGRYIRLAYADSVVGPWKVYEPGVLQVRDTAFYRPQEDAPDRPPFTPTHLASPETFVDTQHNQIVMWVHGMWTDGKKWPSDPGAVAAWNRENGYGQYTQAAVSEDGLHFRVQPGISAKTSYLRVFRWNGHYYGMGRLGVVARTEQLLGPFDIGPSPFDNGPYAGRVRHVGLLLRGDTLYVFFSGIGDSPERIMLSTIALTADWRRWKASDPQEVIAPSEKYECVDLPAQPSKRGESEGPERALRDPALFEEGGKVLLFYSVCGEQGIGAADVTSLVRR